MRGVERAEKRSAMRSIGRRRATGFSLLELLIVMAIILVVSAIATPTILNAIYNVRLRSGASSIAGVLQSARMQAIRSNRFCSVRGVNAATLVNNATAVYADWIGAGAVYGSGNNAWDSGETIVQLPAGVVPDATGANPAFNGVALLGGTFTPVGKGVVPTFNARGLPCVMAGAVCNNLNPLNGQTVNFLYFLRLNTPVGVQWAAVSVTSAGRVRTWVYDAAANTWN